MGKRRPREQNSWKVYLRLFVAGMLWDGILSADVIFTAGLNIAWAMATTATINVLSFKVYDDVIDADGVDGHKLTALTLGCTVGAGLITALFK